MAYFSNLLTATKSRYQSIRGDTDDGDTEDDSHLARCLRAYYQENERPIPDWLGGGPPPVQSLRQTNKMAPPGHGRQGVNASLSDIWDNPQPQRFQQQQTPGGGGGGGPGQRHQHQHQQQQQPGLFPDERRPTPVQDGGAGKALTSAQQRIKERLWGGRTASPPPQGQFNPPPPPQSVQMPGEHMFGGGAPPPRRHGGGGMPWEDEYSGAPGVSGHYGGGSGGSGGNLRRPQQGGSGGRVGLPSGSGMLRGQRGGGY